MDTQYADKILNEVARGYDALAGSFDESRTALWEEQKFFLPYVSEHANILDVGCGNGRLLKLFEGRTLSYTGTDNNAKLVQKAQEYAKQYPAITTQFVIADMRSLPLSDHTFDRVFCIAALHHIPSHTYQLAALKEMHRVLQPGGILCMTNWNLHMQERYVKKRQKLAVQHPDWFDGLSDRDFLISWKWHIGNQTVYRYYYSFAEDELAQLLAEAGFKTIRQELSEGGVSWSKERTKRNVVTVAQKN